MYKNDNKLDFKRLEIQKKNVAKLHINLPIPKATIITNAILIILKIPDIELRAL